jgi:osmoprotectant transport system substrate-binding protein
MIDSPPMVQFQSLASARRPLVVLGLLAALALSGCGGATAPTGASSNPSSASTTAVTTTATGTGTGTGTGTRTGPASSTTTPLPGTGRPVVTIGDMNYTEQFVLGQLYLQALKYQGFKVNITQNIGPPSVVRQAMKNGSLAMYPEYLDDLDQTFAHQRRRFASRAAAYQAAQAWAQRNALTLLTPTPFSDTDAIAVTDAYAAAHRLHTLGDLLDVAGTLVIGGAEQFKTEKIGLRSLASGYGVEPESFLPLAVGDQYNDLDTGAIQAAYVNTTDGQLATGDYRVLGDPARIFGFGNVVPVVSDKAIAEEGPAFTATIERVDRTLTLQTMRELNSAADVATASPSAVALQYLQTHGLLTPLRPSDY